MPYFNYDRKRWAIEDIATCYKCAEKAGIHNNLFVNFGVLLGIVRENDFIKNDDDVDMCVKTDGISKEQQDVYVRLLDENNMFMARKKISRRQDTGMALWFTLRRKPKRAKFCHWWGFEWQKFWWWSKGRRWINPGKFDEKVWGYSKDDQGIALGIPAEYMEKLMWIDFKGIRIQIPEKYGSVLDWEYPGWPIPRCGSSKHQMVCIIPKWSTPLRWRIKANMAL